MSLIKYGIAVAVGYHLGRPQGRNHLRQLRQQVVQLRKRPEVKQWQERGWDIAYERALAAKRLASTSIAGRKNAVDPAVGSATSVTDDTDPAFPARIAGLRARSRRAASWRRSLLDESDPGRRRGHSRPDRVRWSDGGRGLRGRSHRLGPPNPHRTHHAAVPGTPALSRRSSRRNRS